MIKLKNYRLKRACALFAGALMSLAIGSTSLLAQAKPNIVVILADDFGFADTSFSKFGADPSDPALRVNTPNMERLRNSGALCTTGYITGNICAPSRMGLLTGFYQNRFQYWNAAPIGDEGIPATRDKYVYNTTTKQWSPVMSGQVDADGTPLPVQTGVESIASRMKGEGYTTLMTGKWHMGVAGAENPNYSPEKNGFDESLYFDQGGESYYFFHNQNYSGDINYVYTSADKKADRVKLSRIFEFKPGYTDRKVVQPPAKAAYNKNQHYTTNIWTNKTIDFINSARSAGKPYFVYLAYNAVHNPINDPDDESVVASDANGRKLILKMGKELDNGIGRVLDTIGNDNTLVYFLSDNGGAIAGTVDAPAQSDNRPLNKEKHYDYDGGVRTQFVVSWPGVIPAGSTFSKSAVISLDILPTCLAASKSASDITKLDTVNYTTLSGDKLDGQNLLSVLRSGATRTALKARSLFWSGGTEKIGKSYQLGSEAQTAIRTSDNKKLLLDLGDRFHLFDVAVDPSETNDLLAVAYDNTTGKIDTAKLTDNANKDLFIRLFAEYTEQFLQGFPGNGDAKGRFGSIAKPRFKNAWEAAIAFVDQSGSTATDFDKIWKGENSMVIQQGTTVKLIAGGPAKKLYTRSFKTTDGSSLVFAGTPDLQWSLISNIGGIVDQNGNVTPGTTPGYMIVVAQEKLVRQIASEGNDPAAIVKTAPKAYQLIKVE